MKVTIFRSMRVSGLYPGNWLPLLIALSLPALAHGSDHGTWNYRTDVYIWAAGVGGETATGAELDIDFTDLAKDLELGFMGTFAAQKGKWLLELDVIYLDVEDDEGIDVEPEVELKAVELTGWVVNPFVGYRVLEYQDSYLAVLAGARYLDLDLSVDVRTRPPEEPERVSATESEDFWDGIIGIIGRVQIDDHWSIPYYLDVGTGDSDSTWQAYLGIGYRLERLELMAGYRYLDWEFDDDPAFGELDLGGPMIGARFRF